MLAAVLAVPFARSFFALAIPSWPVVATSVAIGVAAIAMLGLNWRLAQGTREPHVGS
jgi:hypothetical protein